MLAADKPPLREAYLEHISEKPWSEFTSADYTPEQWHKACLIHTHEGAPTSKGQCKLPVRTPNGALNRNGVHAAMAVLNGARGGVNAPAAEKMKARSALARLYKELGEEAPGFSTKHDGMTEDELVHFGVKGMKWGQRKPEDPATGRSGGLSPTNQKLVTAAFVAGTVAVGAILLSRGNVQVWNSTSTRIALKGAQTSGKILGKTGTVLVKSSAKITTTVAKGSFKTGKVAGKLTAKAAVGGVKAGGRAAASNGTRYFNDYIKPTGKLSARIGSGVMHKLTGRGTPFVTEVIKRPISKNPIDLLLNVRADLPKLKGR